MMKIKNRKKVNNKENNETNNETGEKFSPGFIEKQLTYIIVLI